jgi:cobalt-zinc-cadmium efflux system outer membrane protein
MSISRCRPTPVVVMAAAGVVLAAAAAGSDEPKLALDQAITLSLAAPRLRAARELIPQAEADALTASLLPRPTATFGADLLPLARPFTVEEPGGPPQLAGGLTFPLDWLLFGKRSAGMASARVGIGIAEAEYADAVRRRVAETTEAFYDVLEAETLVDLARQTVADLEHTETALQKAGESGGRPQVDLSRVRLERQGARREERSARAALISAKAALSALVGRQDGVEVAGTLDGPLGVKPLEVEQAFALALEHRPDILALRQRVAKARRDQVVEDRNARPDAAFGFGVTRQFQRAVGAPDVVAWGASVEVGLPLFDRNQGNRAKARSAAVQAEHELNAATADLRAGVVRAVESLRAARDTATELTQTDLDLASQVRDSIQKAYDAGGRPLIEWLDAQRGYRETYRAYVTSRADYWRALSQYECALGKRLTP